VDISKEQFIKHKLRYEFEFFIRYFFKEINGQKFEFNEHHQQIIDELVDVIQGRTTRLIINIAPRYSKTEIVVKNFIAYILSNNAKAKFIHLSYSDTLALDNSEAIKDFIESEEYQTFFDVKIKRDSKSKKKWYTEEGGGVYASAAGGQVTGFGAGEVEQAVDRSDWDYIDYLENFGGAIIIDDPIKPDDTDSDVRRERINERFDTTIRSRVNSRNTPIIVIMQRLHEVDLSGYLLDNDPGKWTVLSLPCIKEDGSALWPFKHTLKELNHLKSVNEVVFDSQYLQDPSPKQGLMFPKDELNYFTETSVDMSKRESCQAFVDVADKGEDSHCVPFGMLFGNKIFIDDAIFTKEGTEFNVPETIIRCNEHLPEFVQVESNFGGSMYIQLLNISTQPKLNGVTAPIAMTAKANKHVRIQTMAGFIKKYFYFKENFDKRTEYGRFMIELTAYRKTGGNKHDDAPDAVAGLAKMILTYFPDLWSEFNEALANSS
jgi:predicted phage terminase large subunit-like protein